MTKPTLIKMTRQLLTAANIFVPSSIHLFFNKYHWHGECTILDATQNSGGGKSQLAFREPEKILMCLDKTILDGVRPVGGREEKRKRILKPIFHNISACIIMCAPIGHGLGYNE